MNNTRYTKTYNYIYFVLSLLLKFILYLLYVLAQGWKLLTMPYVKEGFLGVDPGCQPLGLKSGITPLPVPFFSYFRPYGSIFSRSYTFIIILVCRNKETQGPYLAVPQSVVYLSALN